MNTTLKKMKLSYDNSTELKNLILQVYYTNSNGKKSPYVNNAIELKEDNMYYKILSGLTYDIKLSNDIIDGTMMFKMKEDIENKSILLYPESTYCIEKEGKYEFY